jgi:hypothetical protein
MSDPVFWQLGAGVFQEALIATILFLSLYYGVRWFLGPRNERRRPKRDLALQLQGPHRLLPDTSHEPTTETWF